MKIVNNVGKKENMKHIYMCRLRKENIKEKYEMIFGENLEQMKNLIER